MKTLIFLSSLTFNQAEPKTFWQNEKMALANFYSMTAADIIYTSKNLHTGRASETNPLYGGPKPSDLRLFATGLVVTSVFTLGYFKMPETSRRIIVLSLTLLETYLFTDNAIRHDRIGPRNRNDFDYREPYFSIIIYQW